MKMIFSGPEDVREPRGTLFFGANGLARLGKTTGLGPATVTCTMPQADGSHLVYGVASTPDLSWKILRFRTWNGCDYEAGEVVYRSEPLAPSGKPWLGHSGVVHNSRDDSLLAFQWSHGGPSHAVWGYASRDGRAWQLLQAKPLYHDHDSISVIWHRQRECYVVYQATYQKWTKLYPDNIGGDRRRVLHLRTSSDGRSWDPPGDVGYDSASFIPAERLITPDAEDPPELEFYRLRVFPYNGRYLGMMLNYAPSPGPANTRHPWTKHGPHLGCEWWLSDDGFKWRRPFRHIQAAGEASGFISHEPLTLGQRHLWVFGQEVFGIPEDRIIFAGALANAEFSTPAFALTDKPLLLNAEFGYDGNPRRGMRGQGYVMAELRDEAGAALAGFEHEKCIVHDLESEAARYGQMQNNCLRLHWNGKTPAELAGRKVSLRLYLRDARIYAVSQ
jgi:hypothetical protein